MKETEEEYIRRMIELGRAERERKKKNGETLIEMDEEYIRLMIELGRAEKEHKKKNS